MADIFFVCGQASVKVHLIQFFSLLALNSQINHISDDTDC